MTNDDLTTEHGLRALLARHALKFYVGGAMALVLGLGVYFAIANAQVMIEHVNPALWVVSNMTLVYCCGALLLWVILYGFRFRWNSTPAGADVFWFTLSLVGVIGLTFIGIFVNGRQQWYIAPPDLLVWRPFLRYLIYTGVAISLTRIDWSLIQRLRGRQPITFEVVPRDRDAPPRGRA